MAVRLNEEWFAICGGCEVTILDIGEPLLDILAKVSIMHMPVLMDHKLFGQTGEKTEMELPEAEVGLIAGGIRSEEHRKIAHGDAQEVQNPDRARLLRLLRRRPRAGQPLYDPGAAGESLPGQQDHRHGRYPESANSPPHRPGVRGQRSRSRGHEASGLSHHPGDGRGSAHGAAGGQALRASFQERLRRVPDDPGKEGDGHAEAPPGRRRSSRPAGP